LASRNYERLQNESKQLCNEINDLKLNIRSLESKNIDLEN